MLLVSFMLLCLSIFALHVGNYLAMLICFGLAYIIFLPGLYIKIRKMMGLM